MEDKPNVRKTQWNTNSMENKWRITSMEDNLYKRQSQWKMTSMADNRKPILFWAWPSSAPACFDSILTFMSYDMWKYNSTFPMKNYNHQNHILNGHNNNRILLNNFNVHLQEIRHNISVLKTFWNIPMTPLPHIILESCPSALLYLLRNTMSTISESLTTVRMWILIYINV